MDSAEPLEREVSLGGAWPAFWTFESTLVLVLPPGPGIDLCQSALNYDTKTYSTAAVSPLALQISVTLNLSFVIRDGNACSSRAS